MLTRQITPVIRLRPRVPRGAIRWIALVGALALVFLVGGCTRVPLSSLWALRHFDFETFDPSVLRVAMHLPGAFSMPRDALKVDAKVKREGEPVHVEQFTLRESKDQTDFTGLPSVNTQEGRWVVLKLDATEAERVKAFRQGIIAAKAEADKAKSARRESSIELTAKPQFCRNGAPTAASAKVAAAMMWSREKGYIPVIREGDVDETMKALDDSRDTASMPACPRDLQAPLG